MKRRTMLWGLASVPLLTGSAGADTSDGPLTLLVAGPDGGATSRWGNACVQAMAGSFPGATALLPQAVGGLDGVSGANQLDAQVMPDGKTAALIPGAALIAFLTGDSRVHFDPTRWTPLLAGTVPGVLMLRGAAGSTPGLEALKAAAPLRIAASAPQSPDLAALLALARLGVTTAPVFGLRDTAAKANAFANGEVDALFLCGEGAPADAAALTAAGAVPVFSLGALAADGTISPDPQFPDLPDALSLGTGSASPLDAAYLAAAAAARLDFLLVLPRLTDPAAVTQWTQAAQAAAQDPAFMSAAEASAVTLQPAAVLSQALTALVLPGPAQTGLQDFLSKTLGWQPN